MPTPGPMRSFELILALAIVAGSAGTAFARLEVAPCPAPVLTRWEAVKAELSDAHPGDKDYLPFPYQSSAREFRADLRYTYLRVRRGVRHAEQLLPIERHLYRVIRSDDFTIGVSRVVDWSPVLCEVPRQTMLYFLIHVYSGDPKEEVARMVLDESGRLINWVCADAVDTPLARDGWARQTPPLEQAVQRVAKAVPVAPGWKATYLTSTLVPFGGLCQAIMPCIVVSTQAKHYLYVPWFVGAELLFSFDPGQRYKGPNDLIRPGSPETLRGERFLAAGSGVWLPLTEIPLG